MKITSEEIKKILIIKPRGIGDIVLSTIVIENLLNHFPNTKIDYLVEEFAKDVLKHNPYLNEVITFSKSEFILKTILKVRKKKYDLIFDLWSNPKTAQITFLSGAKYRVGYNYKGRSYAYNILGTSERGNCHSAFHNLELLKPLDIKIISKKIHFYLSDEEKLFANDFIKKNSLSNQRVVGIIPSGGWDSKRCPPDKWLEIIKSLLEKFTCKILLLWGPDDKTEVDYIKTKMNDDILLAPKTNLRELAAIIEKCDLIIANDSGPMHIAAAMQVPTLGLFGPTDPEKHGPFSEFSDYVIKKDLHCIICNKLECPYNKECFYEMSIDEILIKSEKLLEKNAQKN